MPDRLENSSGTTTLALEPTSNPGYILHLASEPTSDMEPVIVASDLASRTGLTTVPTDLDLETRATSDPALNLGPISLPADQESKMANQGSEIASSNPRSIFHINPACSQAMDSEDLPQSNEMLDRI